MAANRGWPLAYNENEEDPFGFHGKWAGHGYKLYITLARNRMNRLTLLHFLWSPEWLKVVTGFLGFANFMKKITVA